MNEGLDAFLAGKSGLGNTNEIFWRLRLKPAVIETVVVEPPAPEPQRQRLSPVQSATAPKPDDDDDAVPPVSNGHVPVSVLQARA